MDALKALSSKMRAEQKGVGADKKFTTKAELEAAKLLKLREEEETERKRKVHRRGCAAHLHAWLC